MSEAVEAIEAMEARIDDLEARIRDVEQRNADLEAENQELRERVEQLEDDSENARRARKTVFQRLNSVEASAIAATDGGSDGDDAEPGGGSSPIGRTDDLPIEDFARMSDKRRRELLTSKEDRAVTLWKNLPQWGEYNRQSDRLSIKADRTLEKLINAERDGEEEITDWNQRDRILRAAEALSKKTAKRVESRSGWRLVVEQPGTVWPDQYPSASRDVDGESQRRESSLGGR